MNGLQMIEMPATLDLVERADLGINGLLGTLDPETDYECYFLSFLASRPQYMVHWSSMVSGVLPKYLEAVALLRHMSGSRRMLDVEEGMVQAVLRNIAEDGLIYDRKDARRPWNVGVGYGKTSWDEDYSCLAGDGRLVCAMDFYHQATGDDAWRQRMQRTCERMLELAVVRGDYAYYPNVGCGNDFSWPRESGWTHTDEPQGPFDGQEGATTFYLALPIRGWTRWYRYSGDERMLEMSRRFASFVMEPRFWGGKAEPQLDYGRSRGHFHGHFHGTLAAFRGVLEYALAAQDYRAMEFVRDGYEWARQHLCPQLGCDAETEVCALGDLMALAVQLSDAGVGDFWDDVDCLARNALPEAQYTDADGLRALGEAAAEKATHWIAEMPEGCECTDRVLERNLGAMANTVIGGRVQNPMMMSCCNANGNQGFYYAWDAIVRHHDGTATVNLMLNRFSPWIDIASYLPFEGKVVMRNKTARRVSVRIPPWISIGSLRCTVNGQRATPTWCGRYVQFSGLQGREEIVVEFPLETTTRELALSSVNAAALVRLRAEFRGSTCLSTQNLDENAVERTGCRLFDRPEYRGDRAPMKAVPYHVVPNPIRWY